MTRGGDGRSAAGLLKGTINNQTGFQETADVIYLYSIAKYNTNDDND